MFLILEDPLKTVVCRKHIALIFVGPVDVVDEKTHSLLQPFIDLKQDG